LWWGKLERDHLEGLGKDRRMVLEVVFEKKNGEWWMYWFVLGWKHVVGCCEHGDEISCGTGKFLDWLRNYLL
jgi:hypothetical protein